MKKTYKRKRKNVKKYTKRTKKRSNKRNNRRNYKKTYKRSNRKYFKKVKGGKPRVEGCQDEWTEMDDVKKFLEDLGRVCPIDTYIPVILYPELTENPVYYGSVDFTNSAVLFESVVEIFKEKGLDLDTRPSSLAENGIQLMIKVEPENEEQAYVIRWRQRMFSRQRGVRAIGEKYWYYGESPRYPFTTEDKKFQDFKRRITNMFLSNRFNEYFVIVSHGTWMKVFHRFLKNLKDRGEPLIYDIMIDYITEEKQEYDNLEHMYFRITKTSASEITKHFIIVRHCRACHNTMPTASLDGPITKASRLNYGTFSKCLIMPFSPEEEVKTRDMYETAKNKIITDMTRDTDIQNYYENWGTLGLTSWRMGCSPIFRALLTCYNFSKYGLVGTENTRRRPTTTIGVSAQYAAPTSPPDNSVLNRSVEVERAV